MSQVKESRLPRLLKFLNARTCSEQSLSTSWDYVTFMEARDKPRAVHNHTPVTAMMPRSSSMNALSTISPESLKPRISRLESLEATMASIEVSLSGDAHVAQPRRKTSQPQQRSPSTASTSSAPHNRSSINNSSSNSNNNNRLQQQEQQFVATTTSSTRQQRKLQDTNLANDKITKLVQEVETLRQGLLEKDKLIAELKDQNVNLLEQSNTHNENEGTNDETLKIDEVKENQNRLLELDTEMDNKKAAIKTLKLSMDKLEAKDLDARIQQAEMEFQLEREELSILNLQQERNTIKTYLEEKASESLVQKSKTEGSFYSVLDTNSGCMSMVAVEVPYNPQTPNFIIALHQGGKGLYVQWARDNSTLQKGDRLVEVNGQTVLVGSRDQLVQILANASTNEPLSMTVLRPLPSPSPPPQVQQVQVRRVNAKEMENLKDEISSVVNKLDTKIRENKDLTVLSERITKERDKLQGENLKLTHRIAYLEDQVSELQQSWEDLRSTLNQLDIKAIADNSLPNSLDEERAAIYKSRSSSHIEKQSEKFGNDFKKVVKGSTTSIVVNRSSNPVMASNNGGISVVRTNSNGSSVSVSSLSSASSTRDVQIRPSSSLSMMMNRSQDNVTTQTHLMNSVNLAMNNNDSPHVPLRRVTTAKSNSMTSVPSLLNRTSSSVTISNCTNVEVNKQQQQRNSDSTGCVNLVSPSIVKSQSIGQLDRHLKRNNNDDYSHHILQVHVPFTKPVMARVNNGGNGGFTPLTRSASATCSPVSTSVNNGSGNDHSVNSFPSNRINTKQNGFRLHHQLEKWNGRSLERDQSNTDHDECVDLNGSGSKGPLSIHLKMNNNKIALDDFESDNEEWC